MHMGTCGPHLSVEVRAGCGKSSEVNTSQHSQHIVHSVSDRVSPDIAREAGAGDWPGMMLGAGLTNQDPSVCPAPGGAVARSCVPRQSFSKTTRGRSWSSYKTFYIW